MSDDRPSQTKIVELCRDDHDMARVAANAEAEVLALHPELVPGSEEFYRQVLREMGQG